MIHNLLSLQPQAQKTIDWTVRTPASVQAWVSVCRAEALGLFVAVCTTATSGQQVMHSPDGETWTGADATANQNWRSVCFSPTLNLLCAVSQTGALAGRIMTSPDGINWTPRTAASTNQWFFVDWVGGSINLFVALSITGTGNRVMTSPDGITWTSRTSASNSTWNMFAFDGTTIVAVGDAGAMMASTDGVNWSTVSHGTGLLLMRGIAWCESLGLFVMPVSNTGANGAFIAYSEDGTTWTNGYRSPNVTGGIQKPAWSPEFGVLVAPNSTSGGPCATTSNGRMLASSGVIGTDQRWQSTAYSPSQQVFVTVANFGTGDRVATGILAAA